MNIGEAARQSGLPQKTIRYYEEIGLITPDRLDNGYRDFSERHIEKLIFLRRARAFGFSIHDTELLATMQENPARGSAEVKAIASAQLERMDLQISELQAMRATLAALVDICPGNEKADCPILAKLSKSGDSE